MSHIYQQLAPGFGDILPGNFVVPQNPLHPGTMDGVRVPHVGELMPARFAEPENPLLNALQGRIMPGNGGCGSCSGMGALDLSSITTSVSSWASSQPWTTWAVIGAAAIGVFYLSGRGSSGSAYRQEKREMMAKLRAKYRRRGRRMIAAAG